LAFHRQSLENRVIEVRDDKYKTSRLISEFTPFIASVAQKRAGKFLQYGTDEELSVGLSAFKEAMDCYDIARGKFLSFARLVISMRLIDYYRKKGKGKTLSLDDDNTTSALIDESSMEQYRIDDENEARILEIIEYRSELEKWGVSLEQLAEVSPRNESLREQYKDVARVIVGKSYILKTLMETKRLPIKEIEEITRLHRKKLERGRIYIIAIVLAMVMDLSYVDIRRGGGI
jgi:RNA polymerase sigma factor